MTDESPLHILRALGWSDADADVLTPAPCTDARLARVVAQHRTGYEVHDGNEVLEAGIQSSLRKPSVSPDQRPSVGDWVWIAPADDGNLMIRSFLPRRSRLQRAAAGEKHRAQIIATNIDWVFIVCGLDGDFNPRRIERYLAIVQDSGAHPLVLLTKSDQCADAATAIAQVHHVAGSVPVIAINAKSPQTVQVLAPYLGAGNTFVLVGSSGAGKSTLTNTLLGIEKMRTNEVRENDSRGRHTTTHRALIALATGACLIDTPGMREIKLLGEEAIDASTFADIEALTTACRFSDCGHQSGQPGCAINAALADGSLDAQRYQSYLKLHAEQAAAQARAAAGEKRAVDKVAQKAFGKRLTEKYGKR
jgi:ribosome biogenesis GTPase